MKRSWFFQIVGPFDVALWIVKQMDKAGKSKFYNYKEAEDFREVLLCLWPQLSIYIHEELLKRPWWNA